MTLPTAHFLDDLRRTFDACVGPSPAIQFRALRADLIATHDAELGAGAEQAAVDALSARWDALVTAAFAEEREYETLLATLGTGLVTDPAAMGVDLLGVVGRTLDEIVHTRVISKLIDWRHSGPAAVRLLRSLLQLADADVAAKLPDAALAAAIVEPETERRLGQKGIIPDIVVTILDGSRRVIVVLENKTRIRDRERQLDDYRAWAEAEPAEERLFVYLTPHGDEPSAAEVKTSWRALSYAHLVDKWRVDLDALDGPWADVLRLYLATVLRHLLGRTLPATSRGERLLLIPYLRAATASRRDIK